jgi:hypothetical protein
MSGQEESEKKNIKESQSLEANNILDNKERRESKVMVSFGGKHGLDLNFERLQRAQFYYY